MFWNLLLKGFNLRVRSKGPKYPLPFERGESFSVVWYLDSNHRYITWVLKSKIFASKYKTNGEQGDEKFLVLYFSYRSSYQAHIGFRSFSLDFHWLGYCDKLFQIFQVPHSFSHVPNSGCYNSSLYSLVGKGNRKGQKNDFLNKNFPLPPWVHISNDKWQVSRCIVLKLA